jgi:hypothetical protein
MEKSRKGEVFYFMDDFFSIRRRKRPEGNFLFHG